MQGIGYLEGPEIYLWFVAIVLFFLGFVLFTVRAPKIELKSQKMHYIAFGVISLSLGITRIFFILGVFFPDYYDTYTIMGYLSALIGILFFLYILETYLVQKTKRILFILSLVVFIFSLIALFGGASRYLALDIQSALLPFILGSVGLLYIYLIIKTTGTLRKKVIGIVIGLLLIAAGQLLDGEGFLTAFPDFSFIVAPMVMIGGILLFYFAQLYYQA